MDEEGPKVARVSSCRGVTFELSPKKINIFSIDTEEYANDVWFTWIQQGNNVGSSARSRSTPSIHFCDFDDLDYLSGDDEEFHDEEACQEEAQTPQMDGNGVCTGDSCSYKPLPKPEVKGHNNNKQRQRVSTIMLDQGLFTVYKRLFLLSLSLNLICLLFAIYSHFEIAKKNASLFSIWNIFILTLARSEAFLRLVFWFAVAVLGKPWIPLVVKTSVTSFLQSLGGIHSGCGVASIAWLVYAVVLAIRDRENSSPEILGVSFCILALISLSSLAAFPLLRHLHHNFFERTHRFAGWTALGLLWVFIVLTKNYEPSSRNYHFRTSNFVQVQEFWLTAIITVLIILPWISVRKVPVKVSCPSGHASLMKFEGGVKAGLLGRISLSPLSEWHAFGIISDGKKEHMMLAGVVGDFTQSLVKNPPSHLWVRTVHFAGLPYLVNMYKKVLLVATGSGICVFLSFLLQPCAADIRLVWVAKGIEQNFGKEIMEMVESYPKEKVFVRDTAVCGRPNMAEISVEAAKRWEAEVVIVTSNPVGTRDVVRACEKAGIAAFGPIWDS